jgi:hypothetical protein
MDKNSHMSRINNLKDKNRTSVPNIAGSMSQRRTVSLFRGKDV